jgi:hypothetical protein
MDRIRTKMLQSEETPVAWEREATVPILRYMTRNSTTVTEGKHFSITSKKFQKL